MPTRRSYVQLLSTGLAGLCTGCLGDSAGVDTPTADGTATTPTPAGTHDHDSDAGGSASPDGIEAAELTEAGDTERLADVEQFPDEGNKHVESGTDIEYERTPPLSGPHYDTPTAAGFYAERQPAGNLVHALEHGAVVVYYDPNALSGAAGDDDSAEESLREFATTHTGVWGSVVAVPSPTDDPAADFVLTAWRHRLYLDSYDAQTVFAFLSEFLGRGPENPVR